MKINSFVLCEGVIISWRVFDTAIACDSTNGAALVRALEAAPTEPVSLAPVYPGWSIQRGYVSSHDGEHKFPGVYIVREPETGRYASAHWLCGPESDYRMAMLDFQDIAAWSYYDGAAIEPAIVQMVNEQIMSMRPCVVSVLFPDVEHPRARAIGINTILAIAHVKIGEGQSTLIAQDA